MSVTYDFRRTGANIAGVAQICPQTEEGYSYLVEETLLTVCKDGSAALFDERVGDFVSDAGHAHLCCELV